LGLLDRLFRSERKEERGESVSGRLDALGQLDGKWSPEKLRRRVRDCFFAVQRSWIERDPAIGEPYMTPDLLARQKLRIDGLVSQHRVHQLENPLIEDLDFVAYSEGGEGAEPEVTALLEVSVVETILDAESGALVAGRPNFKLRNREYWTFAWRDNWVLAEVEQPGEGARHMKAPLVGGDYAELSPESVLRERYARGEIELEEFEREMAGLLGREQRY
jgi:inner membrane protein import complex subunit Tim44-like protein